MSLTKKSKQTFNRDKSRDQERFNYLERLKLEFENPQTKKNAKHQTLSNLANFAYNPENYGHLYRLSIHHLFAMNIDSPDSFIGLISLKGLCNLASYPLLATFFSEINFQNKVIQTMKSRNEYIDFVINSLLLFVTLKKSKLTIDQSLMANFNQIVTDMPIEIKKDNRVNNLYKILNDNSL